MLKSSFALLSCLLMLAACGPAPTSASYPEPMAYPSAEPSASSSLANLLTGQVVDSQEQQLRDNLQRQIVLDFPIRVGVVYYQLNSTLDKVDQDALLDRTRSAFAETDLIKETLLIPQSFVSGAQSIEALRTLGSRFQTDVLLIVTGQHDFSPSRQQSKGFFESFSDTIAYESQVSLEAIALDVYTGTLLKPFESAAKGEPIRLSSEAPDFHDRAYAYKKSVEEQAWLALQTQAVEGFQQLKIDVDEALAGTSTPASTGTTTSAEAEFSVTPSPAPSASASPGEMDASTQS